MAPLLHWLCGAPASCFRPGPSIIHITTCTLLQAHTLHTAAHAVGPCESIATSILHGIGLSLSLSHSRMLVKKEVTSSCQLA